MNPKALIIAVDGYSSTGKSTVSKLLAARLGYVYIDSGAMYRMVTYEAMRRGILRDGKVEEESLRQLLKEMHFDFRYNPSSGLYESFIDGERVEEQIRGMEVSGQVSMISAIPYVREVLVEKQREMACRGGVVMDGRDIGSVVFPDADVKFFMTASPEVRAKRRFDELQAKGEQVSYEAVEKNIRERDYLDAHRAVSPLVRTPDAVVIDNGSMTVEEVVEKMWHEIAKRHADRD